MFNKKSLYGGNRRSIRLKEYDYSKAGLYFITICCQNGEHLFGEITEGKVLLNKAGKMVDRMWNEIPSDFSNAVLHEYVIMPNHLHGIIEIQGEGADSISALVKISRLRAEMDSARTRECNIGLSRIIQSFKRHSTIEYIKMVKRVFCLLLTGVSGREIIGIALFVVKKNWKNYQNTSETIH